MIEQIPAYSAVELQIALDEEISFPKGITELDFQHQIQSNRRIKWDVNPFVLEEDNIRILLDASGYNWWKATQHSGVIVGTLLAYWGLRTWTVEMLLLLLLLPFTIVPLPHAWFIICAGIAVSVKLYFNLFIPLFWIIIFLTGCSYVITKTAEDRAKNAIIRQGLKDWQTFWKFYSNHIIYPVWTANNDEIRYLVNRYPELCLLEDAEIDK